MAPREEIRTFDLFCGGGGSSCGARMAGATPVGGIDLWQTAINTFELNFPDALTWRRRIEGLSAKRISKAVGRIDLLLASPECTNHSVAKGNAPRCEISRRTAFEVIRFAKSMKPRWVIVENVVSMRRWQSYKEWFARLQGVGYNLVEAVLDSHGFGVSQSRKRLFVIGDREKRPLAPAPHHKSTATARMILSTKGPDGIPWRFSQLDSPTRAKPTLERARRAIEVVGPKKPFLIVYYGSDAAGGWQSIDRPLRTITTLDRFALVQPKGIGHVLRMLQPPELAAAMGFPENYNWPDTTRRNRIKLIGNAVSPPVVKAIVETLRQ
jgi:DNA (cytosine-5)-methyltransferase 1